MMNLVSLMEIWAIRNNVEDPMEMLKQGEFDSRIDKDLLAARIVQMCGAMHPLYNTSDSFMYFHKTFFKMWKPQISKLLDTMEYEYSPLENFRRDEKLRHKGNEKTKDEGNRNSESESKDEITANGTNEDKTSAYNENVYQPNEINETSQHSIDNSNSKDKVKTSNDRNKDIEDNEDNLIHGLNGLFTSQNLLEQERKVSEYNVYQWIVQKYMEELFICVF